MNEATEQFNATFDQITNAAKDPVGHTLTLHMWEKYLGFGAHRLVEKDVIDRRAEEISSLLSVMANESGARYCDRGFLGKDFIFRNQSARAEGAVGLATTPFTSKVRLRVFNGPSRTGLLLLNATPVACLATDSGTLYYDRSEALPESKYLRYMGKRLPHFVGYKRFAEDESLRQSLVGKLTIMQKFHNEKWVQDPFKPTPDPNMPYYQLDPLSPEVQQKARENYPKLIDHYAEVMKKYREANAFDRLRMRIDYPEVNVNATLQNAAGIVAYHSAQDKEPAFDPSKSLDENFKGCKQLLVTLYHAMKEHEQLAEKMRKHHIPHQPTIVIYQPFSKEHPIVHCPPTRQFKLILEGAMKAKGLLPKTEAIGRGAS